ncbi:MAG: Acetylornithine aminotransferase [Anaerolineales bacterium]|nr:Acetylornithine aminotransferase [Anaerolineales bacterium]
MNPQAIIKAEKKYIVQTYKRPPFVLERGDGVYLYDTKSQRYTDFVAGIAVNALGYNHPAVLQALREQAEKLVHVSNLYHTAPHVELAQRLVENSFADRVYFCNSGAESIESAMKFARRWARAHFDDDKHEFLAFSGSFHGRTMGALAATDRLKYQEPFEPLMPGVTFADFNDLEDAAAKISDTTCAVIVEPIQGEGGVRPADPEFLAGLRALCDERNALLVFDEVQCGLGRTGTLWAHEAYDVTPDIMCLAKPLANGLPIGATLVTEGVADAIHVGDHASTFAANALVCHVACAVFDVVSAPDFLAGVCEKGDYLLDALQNLDAPQVADVRGRGLMVGVQLTGEAAPAIQAGYENGFILVNAGPDVLRLVPPLIIETDHIDALVDALPELLEAVEEAV